MKQTVFIDTDVIIEACRIKIWKNLLEAYNIHTVEKVVEECNPKPPPPKKQFTKNGLSKNITKLVMLRL